MTILGFKVTTFYIVIALLIKLRSNSCMANWTLSDEFHSLSLYRLPTEFVGTPERLNSISSALCQLRKIFRLRLTCCATLLIESAPKSYRYPNISERLVLWNTRVTTVGDPCRVWAQLTGDNSLGNNTRVCQALHCYPAGFVSAYCRVGCIYCGSPCGKSYFSSYSMGW